MSIIKKSYKKSIIMKNISLTLSFITLYLILILALIYQITNYHPLLDYPIVYITLICYSVIALRALIRDYLEFGWRLIGHIQEFGKIFEYRGNAVEGRIYFVCPGTTICFPIRFHSWMEEEINFYSWSFVISIPFVLRVFIP